MNEQHIARGNIKRRSRMRYPRTRAIRSNRLNKLNGFKKLASPNGKHSFKGNGHAQNAILITGGAGFIGTNLAHRLLQQGKQVLIFDDLSRAGVRENLRWLQATHPKGLQFQRGTVLDRVALTQAVGQASHVFHFAAQVAVTTSLEDPIEDFEVNGRGTLNVLEAIRSQPKPPSIVFTSTNKVYGDLAEIALEARGIRYEPAEQNIRAHGFNETCPLVFHSPYGCSKGAACQYVLDYARTFGLQTVVFRMSCIYGPHQFGNEDQGWVAHFLINALEKNSITVYGDGRQVRDILYVDDVVDAFLLAQKNIHTISGEAFNIGGGPINSISLLELLNWIRELQGAPARADFSNWRPADQKYYVSDTRKFRAYTGWLPKVEAREGVRRLYHWLKEFGSLPKTGRKGSDRFEYVTAADSPH